jgi:hypothetical protein
VMILFCALQVTSLSLTKVEAMMMGMTMLYTMMMKKKISQVSTRRCQQMQ